MNRKKNLCESVVGGAIHVGLGMGLGVGLCALVSVKNFKNRLFRKSVWDVWL